MVTELTPGLDFRRVEYRREVFLRFYEFHLRYRSHPGAVYYLMPYLAETYDWGMEQKLWFAYLNGNTQNPVTSYIIMHHFPTLADLDLAELQEWFSQSRTYRNLQWDTDRRYHKGGFVGNVQNYQELIGGQTQQQFFQDLCQHETPAANFRATWDVVSRNFRSFGRLSTFSYLEYVRIMGVNLDCDQLFLDDRAGSRSHRNGLCIVNGQDELDWHQSNPTFKGVYSDTQLETLSALGADLLSDMQQRVQGKAWAKDVSYFTLESALCTYKSWHRPNRRYPNVYNDLGHDRIRYAEHRWARPSMKVFWQGRRTCLPKYLRLEDQPKDLGCVPIKQNFYRATGQVIMMEHDWECFANAYGARYLDGS